MPRVQTTGVEIVIRSRATMARMEIKGLRKDVAEFGKFTRDTFKGLGGKNIPAPSLSREWRTLEKDVVDITTNIRKAVESVNNLKLLPPRLRYLGQQYTPSSPGGGSSPAPSVGGGTGVPSRQQEIAEAARLTREYRAGTIAVEEYGAALETVSSSAVAGSEKQLDALTRLNNVRRKSSQEWIATAKAGTEAITRTGDVMTAGVTVPIVAGFTAMAKSAIGFDTEMRNVNSIAQLSEKDFNALYSSVLKVAKDPSIKQMPTDLAKALYEIESSGFTQSTKYKDLDVLKMSAKGATAGLSDTATASNALIAVLNSGIGGVTSAQQAMDVLFQTVNDGKLNFTELASVIGGILPTATKAGLSIQQVGGAIAYMTIQGQSAGEATNDLLNLVTKIANPGREAEGIFRKLGIAYGFSGLQAKGLPAIIQQINEKTGGNADIIKRLLPDMQAQRAVLSLLKNDVKDYIKYVGNQAEAEKGQGATQRALNEQTKAFSFQFGKLRQEFEVLAAKNGPAIIGFLRSLLGQLKPLIDSLTGAAEAFSKMDSEQQQTILRLVAFVAAIGPVLSGLGRVGGGIVDLIKVYRMMVPEAALAAGGIGTVTTAAGGLTKALGVLGKIGKIAVTVGIVVTGAQLLGDAVKNLDKLAGGGTKDAYATILSGLGYDSATTDRIRKNGIPTLSDTVGEFGAMLGDFGKAGAQNKLADSLPFAEALRRETTAREGKTSAMESANRFLPLASRKTNNFSEAERHSIENSFRSRGIATFTDGGTDWRKLAERLVRLDAKQAKEFDDEIAAAIKEQKRVRESLRRELGSEQTGRRLGWITPGKGVNLTGLDERSLNVLSAIGGSRSRSTLGSVTKTKSGQRQFGFDSLTEGDAEAIQDALMNYAASNPGGFLETGVATISAKREGNKVVVTVTPPTEAAKKKGATGTMLRGISTRASRAKVTDVPILQAEEARKALEDQYSTAIERFSDNRKEMTEATKTLGVHGLQTLANRIMDADERVAAAKLKQALDAASVSRKEGERLALTAESVNEQNRALDTVKEADRKEREAKTTYQNEINEIQREHSRRFRAITKAGDDASEKIYNEDARTKQQSFETEARAIEERIKGIEDALKNEQDAAKRQDLLQQRTDLQLTAASLRWSGANAVAGAIENPADRRRAKTQAGADFTAAIADITREASVATKENAQFAIEQEIKLHEIRAEAFDDLISKNAELTAAETKRIELMRAQGSPEVFVKAQQDANERAQRQRAGEIAGQGAQQLLVDRLTDAPGSWVNSVNPEAFRKILGDMFKTQFEAADSPATRGRTAQEQFDLLTKAVDAGAMSMQEIVPLLRDVESRVNSGGDIEQTQAFYKAFREFFGKQLKETLAPLDKLTTEKRTAGYNSLINGVKNGSQFADLSDKEKAEIVRELTEKRDDKEGKTAKKEKPAKTGFEAIGRETAATITKSLQEHGGDLISVIFGRKNQDKSKSALKAFWGDVMTTGRESASRVLNESILKPIGAKFQNALKDSFHGGAREFEKVLGTSLKSFERVFITGVSGILQAASYLNGVLALSGKQGKRSQKGGILGAVGGLALGLATGGAGLALLGASLTGASVGSSVAQGNYLQAGLALAGGFGPGGGFSGAGHAAATFSGLKALGGGVSAGHLYGVNEPRLRGSEAFIPNKDGLIIPSAVDIARLPALAAINTVAITNLTEAVANGAGNNNYTLNDFGDKHYEADGERTIRKFTRGIRDTMNRKT
jgi:TP901 family phage tail tape measure protein